MPEVPCCVFLAGFACSCVPTLKVGFWEKVPENAKNAPQIVAVLCGLFGGRSVWRFKAVAGGVFFCLFWGQSS